jgi:hypothetical protein
MRAIWVKAWEKLPGVCRSTRASLDVTDPELVPAGNWLYGHPSVFLTPHSSWSGRPPFWGSFGIFCDNLARYLARQPLQHAVPDGYSAARVDDEHGDQHREASMSERARRCERRSGGRGPR